jgi:CRP-like cAMP-binding protein
MLKCQGNRFCDSLPVGLRAKLCKHCIKTSFAAGFAFPIDFNHPWLLIEGFVCVRLNDRPSTFITPGDVVLTPRFRPSMPNILALSDDDMMEYYRSTNFECLSLVLAATFSTKIFLELFDDPTFVKAVLDCTLISQAQQSLYQARLYHGSAYDAVRYILKLARAYGVGTLTHAQIARLSGRNRTTVTKALHEVALAEPELISETS